MNYQYKSLHGYVFGEGCYDGIAILAGGAGIEADYTIDRSGFESIIKSYLDGEDEELRKELLMLLEEFSDKDLLDELYEEFLAYGEERARELAEGDN